jgi:hypothetical protein
VNKRARDVMNFLVVGKAYRVSGRVPFTTYEVAFGPTTFRVRHLYPPGCITADLAPGPDVPHHIGGQNWGFWPCNLDTLEEL